MITAHLTSHSRQPVRHAGVDRKTGLFIRTHPLPRAGTVLTKMELMHTDFAQAALRPRSARAVGLQGPVSDGNRHTGQKSRMMVSIAARVTMLAAICGFASGCDKLSSLATGNETPEALCSSSATFDLVYQAIAEHTWPSAMKKAALPLGNASQIRAEFPLSSPVVLAVDKTASRVNCSAEVTLRGPMIEFMPVPAGIKVRMIPGGVAATIMFAVGRVANTGARVVDVDRVQDVAVLLFTGHAAALTKMDNAPASEPSATSNGEEYQETQKNGVGPDNEAAPEVAPTDNSPVVWNASKPGWE